MSNNQLISFIDFSHRAAWRQREITTFKSEVHGGCTKKWAADQKLSMNDSNMIEIMNTMYFVLNISLYFLFASAEGRAEESP